MTFTLFNSTSLKVYILVQPLYIHVQLTLIHQSVSTTLISFLLFMGSLSKIKVSF